MIAPLEIVGALAVGAAFGLLGGGGSILTVPIFVYAAGLDPKVAIAASLPVVALTSSSAAIAHWRLGNVQIRTALVFGASAAIGSFGGARLAVLISGAVQFSLLALLMLVAAARMLFSQTSSAAELQEREHIPYAILVPVAITVGVMTGVVGIGGGFLIVPTLVLVCRMPMRFAVGTSLMVIAINAAAGAAGYAGKVAIPWMTVFLFSAIAITGSLLASRLSKAVPTVLLRRGFGVLLIALSALILFQNRHVFIL